MCRISVHIFVNLGLSRFVLSKRAVVSNRKFDVAQSGLLKASLQSLSLLEAVIWKGALLSRFTVPAVFCVTEMLWLCTAAGFCCPSAGFVDCFSVDLSH